MNFSDFFESGDNESTRKLEQKLKVTSVELIKTLANNYESLMDSLDDGGGSDEDPTELLGACPIKSMPTECMMGNSGNVRFGSRDGELHGTARRQWRWPCLSTSRS